jgi:rhomboid family GlyGly-CTERM serine protease
MRCGAPSLTEPARRAGWRARLRRPGTAWLAISALLAGGALLSWFGGSAGWDWQPHLAAHQPWRWWSAALVHLSLLHLLANLLATALVAAYGWAARAPVEIALAWLAAWPLTHLALLAKPELTHYGGLSGVLHAGVAAVSVLLVMRAAGAQRFIGWMMLIGQAIKLLVEESWGAALHPPTELDVAVAPLAHAAGSLAGALFAWLALRLTRRSA